MSTEKETEKVKVTVDEVINYIFAYVNYRMLDIGSDIVNGVDSGSNLQHLLGQMDSYTSLLTILTDNVKDAENGKFNFRTEFNHLKERIEKYSSEANYVLPVVAKLKFISESMEPKAASDSEV
jgi:hypothetical protein